MTSLAVEFEIPRAENVAVTEDTLSVDLSDGRTISVPLAWYPRLLHASQKEREKWELIGRGNGIHWEDIDEDIGVESLLAGKASGESHRWERMRASCSCVVDRVGRSRRRSREARRRSVSRARRGPASAPTAPRIASLPTRRWEPP